jgi:hypothetical protein
MNGKARQCEKLSGWYHEGLLPAFSDSWELSMPTFCRCAREALTEPAALCILRLLSLYLTGEYQVASGLTVGKSAGWLLMAYLESN